MKKKSKHIIIYSFQSLEDPLLKGLMLEYIKRINQKRNDIFFHLISHEQKHYKLSDIDKKNKKNELIQKNIHWYTINYKSGTLLLLKKAFNFIQSFFICFFIKLKYKPKAIIGFLPIAGGYSYLISKILNIRLVVFCFEPHSEYMIEFETWKKNSLKYKLLRKFEFLQLKHAKYVTLPTQKAVEYYKSLNFKGKYFYLPISIDTNQFQFSPKCRIEIRNLINAKDKTILIYTGKFDGIYYPCNVIINFFKKLHTINNNLFLYIITPDFIETKKQLQYSGINHSNYFISNIVPYTELHKHLSASDLGIIAIPPLPSQAYRTPVKTGLYLSCGLPYIVNKGVGDNDTMAISEKVGIVIDDIEKINPEKLNLEIINYLSQDKLKIQYKCRETAIKYQDINLSVNILCEIIEKF